MRDRDSLLLLLMHLGFVINWKTSMLITTQITDFLGFTVNSMKISLHLPLPKLDDIISKCQLMIGQKTTTVCKLSELVGLLTSVVQQSLLFEVRARALSRTLCRRKRC